MDNYLYYRLKMLKFRVASMRHIDSTYTPIIKFNPMSNQLNLKSSTHYDISGNLIPMYIYHAQVVRI